MNHDRPAHKTTPTMKSTDKATSSHQQFAFHRREKKYKQLFEVVSTVTELEDVEHYRNHLEQSKAAGQKWRNEQFIRANPRAGYPPLGPTPAASSAPGRSAGPASSETKNTRWQAQKTAEETTVKISFLISSLNFPRVTKTAQKQAHFLHWRSFPGRCFLKSGDELWDCPIPGAGLYLSLLYFLGIPAGPFIPLSGKWALWPTVTSVHTTPLVSVLFLQAPALWCKL